MISSKSSNICNVLEKAWTLFHQKFQVKYFFKCPVLSIDKALLQNDSLKDLHSVIPDAIYENAQTSFSVLLHVKILWIKVLD